MFFFTKAFSGAFIFTLLLNLGASIMAETADGDYEQRFVALEKFVAGKGWLGDGVIIGSGEYQAIQQCGVGILPALRKRMATANASMLPITYGRLFKRLAGFTPYYYSASPDKSRKMDIYEPDLKKLPYLSRDVDAPMNMLEQRSRILSWWDRLQDFDDFPAHLSKMREIIASAREGSVDFPWQEYRNYTRAFLNYGIFNIPAFITLIAEENNDLAFMEFLCVTAHEEYVTMKLIADRLYNLRYIARVWDSHEKRKQLVKEWWAENQSGYTVLPNLAKAIEAAAEKL